MSRRAELVVRRRTLMSRSGRPETFEVLALVAPRYWSLLWPRAEDVSSLFRMVTLPVRVVPVAVLWATSRPLRLLLSVVLGVASAVLLTR